MIDNMDFLKKQKEAIEKERLNSPTAFGSNKGAPTPYDLSLDKQLSSVNKQIEKLRGEQLSNQWYGDQDNEPNEAETPSNGVLMKTLKGLQTPLNAIIGAGQYALGKGTKSSLTENINEAVKNNLTAGNVLQQYGAPRAVQIPLGFALDVMFDPITWLTAGTSALIPRVGTGLVKGTMKGGLKTGLEAAGTGLVSNLEKKAVSAMKFVPGVKTIAKNAEIAVGEGIKPNIISRGAMKYTDLVENLSKKAIVGGEKYDNLIGREVYSKLNKGIFGQPAGWVGETAENLIKKIPSKNILGKMTPSGEKIIDFFKYSPKTAAEIADTKDLVFQTAKKEGVILVRGENGFHFESIGDYNDPNAVIMMKQKVVKGVEGAIEEADGVFYKDVPTKIWEAPGVRSSDITGPIKIKDSLENAKSLLGDAVDDQNLKKLLDAAYKKVTPGKSGFQWYDDVVEKVKETSVGDIVNKVSKKFGGKDLFQKVEQESEELVKNWNSYGNKVLDLRPLNKILEKFPLYTSIFKAAKVPMNVGSHIVANIGNFFMGAMMGLPVQKIEYYNSLKKASSFLSGKTGAKGLAEMFLSDANSLLDMMENRPNRFRQFTGMNINDILSKINIQNAILGSKNLGSKEETLKFLKKEVEIVMESSVKGKLEAAKEMAKMNVELEKIATPAQKQLIEEGLRTPNQTAREMIKEAPLTQVEMPTGFSGELTDVQFMEKLKAKVDAEIKQHPYNIPAQIANLLVNNMPKWYERIDQTWKIGTTDYLTHIGLTEKELLMVARGVEMTADDILPPIVKDAEKMYRLKPLKASEVAMEAYMNYAAMPDFIKLMRAIPFGHPFASFPYAMAVKTGKTAIDNPAIFNKVGMMLNEINAGRTPQERDALESKYNKYLNSPTVIKTFGIWNTNVKNWVPWYQMNMFNPSQRRYDLNSNEGKIMQMFDKVPVFQDPLGAIIRDYWIQPWVLSGTGQMPQGQFGQPLYENYDIYKNPKKVGAGKRLLYSAKGATEALVPGSLSLLGPLASGLSPEAINMIPSYGIKSTAFAAKGMTSIGEPTKEEVTRKTLRTLFTRSGIPAYPLDIEKTSNY